MRFDLMLHKSGSFYAIWRRFLHLNEYLRNIFFVASAFRPVWPGRCDLSFICIPQSTRALDQGGVEPRQAVSPKALRPWTIPLRYSVGWMNTCEITSHRTRPMLPSMRMHEGSLFFFLRLPIGQYGPVSQLSRSEESCTGPFNWGEAHCAGEKVKRKIGPFLRKSLKNQTRTRTQQKGRSPHARGLTEHLVQFLAEWILMALEPARAITKTRAPDFLFLHEKDFWFKHLGGPPPDDGARSRRELHASSPRPRSLCDWADGENQSNQNEDLQLALFCPHLDGTVRCP